MLRVAGAAPVGRGEAVAALEASDEVADVAVAGAGGQRVDGEVGAGWAISKATKRSGPTVYSTMDRLEDAGWITGR